jgi:hypothetical protein
MPQVPQVHAEFAPNAFSAPPQYATGADINMGGHWYDRVLDLLLGEDETSPKNRIILICQNCRLVNGQAPPGTKSLAELGKWKCFGCGQLNGEEDEGAKAVQEMKELIHTSTEDAAKESADETHAPDISREENTGGENEAVDDDEAEDESAGDTIEASKPKRGPPKGSKKKA